VKRSVLWADYAQNGLVKDIKHRKVVQNMKHACRLVRLETYRAIVVRQRQEKRRQELMAGIREWGFMMREDRVAMKIRPYLTCPQAQFEEMAEAFALFDKDHSGTLSVSEFQQLMYELGETLTFKQVKDAMRQIDTDGSGVIEFPEFVVWWLSDGAKHTGTGASKLGFKLLNTKLAAKKKLRETKVVAKQKLEATRMEAAVAMGKRKQAFAAAARKAALMAQESGRGVAHSPGFQSLAATVKASSGGLLVSKAEKERLLALEAAQKAQDDEAAKVRRAQAEENMKPFLEQQRLEEEKARQDKELEFKRAQDEAARRADERKAAEEERLAREKDLQDAEDAEKKKKVCFRVRYRV
jgi:hypothetical protein